MEHIKLKFLLMVEVVLALIYAVAFRSRGKASVVDALMYPVKKIGEGLRLLSLSGAVGNVFAVIFYVVLCALPLVLLAVHISKKNVRGADALLIAISVTAFFVIYWFINPSTMPKVSPTGIDMTNEAYPVFLLLSMVLAYVVIRIVAVLDGGVQQKTSKKQRKLKQKNVLKVLGGACIFAMAVVIFEIFGANLAELMKNLCSQESSPLNPERNVRITQAVMLLRYLVEQIPLVFVAILAKNIRDMIPAMQTTLVNESVIAAVGTLVRICKVSIITIVLSQVGLNLTEFLAAGYNNQSNMELQFPVLPLLLIAGLMLVAKLVEESAEIQQENEMFI